MTESAEWLTVFVSLPVRILFVASSLIIVGSLIWTTVRIVRSWLGGKSGFHIHGPDDSISRILFHILLAASAPAVMLVVGSFQVSRLRDIDPRWLWSVGLFVAIVAVWAWVEKEFAWPGWFVAREARGVKGEFFSRRERCRREQAELIDLGKLLLERERANEERTPEGNGTNNQE